MFLGGSLCCCRADEALYPSVDLWIMSVARVLPRSGKRLPLFCDTGCDVGESGKVLPLPPRGRASGGFSCRVSEEPLDAQINEPCWDN